MFSEYVFQRFNGQTEGQQEDSQTDSQPARRTDRQPASQTDRQLTGTRIPRDRLEDGQPASQPDRQTDIDRQSVSTPRPELAQAT